MKKPVFLECVYINGPRGFAKLIFRDSRSVATGIIEELCQGCLTKKRGIVSRKGARQLNVNSL